MGRLGEGGTGHCTSDTDLLYMGRLGEGGTGYCTSDTDLLDIGRLGEGARQQLQVDVLQRHEGRVLEEVVVELLHGDHAVDPRPGSTAQRVNQQLHGHAQDNVQMAGINPLDLLINTSASDVLAQGSGSVRCKLRTIIKYASRIQVVSQEIPHQHTPRERDFTIPSRFTKIYHIVLRNYHQICLTFKTINGQTHTHTRPEIEMGNDPTRPDLGAAAI